MLTMNFTYRIYPDAIQQQLMQSWLETCRFVYNRALRQLKDWIASRKSPIERCSLVKEYIIPANTPFPSYQRQQNDLPKLKKEIPELSQVYSQVLQTTVRRLHDTWDAFQARGFGFPRFKKFGQFTSFVFPQFQSSPITNYHIKLPKIGYVRINMHRPIPEGFVVKQVRVLSKCRNTQWYVVVTIQSGVSVPDVSMHGRAIGIDLGLERFLTTSDGSSVERPKFFKSLKSELRLLQLRGARRQKRSKNWEKAQTKVARLHHKIANTRKDYHLKTAHSLCNQAQTIFVEDLNTVGLNRGMLRKECVDASFGAFLSLLQWVCWKRGVYFRRVDPRGTSQTCPECQATVTKLLSEREHICPDCGYRTHRDHAAASMVLLRGIELISTAGLAGMETACADELAGNESSSQVSKSRKGVTRKSPRRLREARTITRSV
jgi:putative transposase